MPTNNLRFVSRRKLYIVLDQNAPAFNSKLLLLHIKLVGLTNEYKNLRKKCRESWEKIAQNYTWERQNFVYLKKLKNHCTYL